MKKKGPNTTLEEDFNDLVLESCFYMLANDIIRKGFMDVVHGKTTKQTKSNHNITSILANLGLINTFIDGTITLTRLGDHIINQMIDHTV